LADSMGIRSTCNPPAAASRSAPARKKLSGGDAFGRQVDVRADHELASGQRADQHHPAGAVSLPECAGKLLGNPQRLPRGSLVRPLPILPPATPTAQIGVELAHAVRLPWLRSGYLPPRRRGLRVWEEAHGTRGSAAAPIGTSTEGPPASRGTSSGWYSYVMRPLRYSINVTLDGCCDHRVMSADEDLHRHAVENLDRADEPRR